MSTPTMPDCADNDRATSGRPPLEGDARTDDGLHALMLRVQRSGSWEQPAGRRLLAEIRRRAVRNAAHVASATGAALDRGLVDDVLLAAWMILRRHGDNVLAAARPWAYLMSSAQKHVLDEVRAQQLLTNSASIRGRAREVLPTIVRPVGSTATDLANALRHEPRGNDGGTTVVTQVGRRHQPPLLDAAYQPGTSAPIRQREPWFAAFVDLLVTHGADQAVTVAAVDRVSDLLGHTCAGWWEWAARRDPVLASLGLTPDQCGALVALLAGSRRYRHNGRHDSLLAAVRTATEHGGPVELSPAQRRRLATFAGNRNLDRPQARPVPGLVGAVAATPGV